MYNEFLISVDKFMANVFAEMFFFYNGYLCFNFGYTVQSILLTLETLL